jgi:hypothetical protein
VREAAVVGTPVVEVVVGGSGVGASVVESDGGGDVVRRGASAALVVVDEARGAVVVLAVAGAGVVVGIDVGDVPSPVVDGSVSAPPTSCVAGVEQAASPARTATAAVASARRPTAGASGPGRRDVPAIRPTPLPRGPRPGRRWR